MQQTRVVNTMNYSFEHEELQEVLEDVATSDPKDLVVFNDDCTLYFHDGTERPIPRPTDAAKQKEFYSGKKNSTALKTTL